MKPLIWKRPCSLVACNRDRSYLEKIPGYKQPGYKINVGWVIDPTKKSEATHEKKKTRLQATRLRRILNAYLNFITDLCFR